ncbi:MAG TPA: ABC transporter ATP-binding protein, partial [Longimicrobiales bacterium]|nr:ABC transporter ATP-binding protein [Longimicrobiales bacterium]
NPSSRKEVLQSTGIEALENRLFGHLSGGERQRVMLALALCGNPDLLFLDEPTVGMDVESRRLLWDHIRAAADYGRAVLLTTHYLDEADALAQRVVVINKGNVIADGAAHEIKQRVALRRIRCTTVLSDSDLTKMRGVETVRRSPGSVEIMTSAAESVVRDLLAQDQGLSGLEVTGAGLEDAFIALTKETA